MLEVKGVSKCYKNGTGREVHALRGISLRVSPGRCRGIVGESGCGKSTLCRLLAGIERADSGEILYKGKPVAEAVRGQGRHEIQMIFQNSLDASPLHFTALRMISEPLTNFTRAKRSERVRRVKELLHMVGIPESELRKYPYQFSGGQLQRVCIARALAAEPELLLLDEPLSSLDVSVQAQILNLLSDLKKELNLTMVLVSHDLEAVYYLSDAVTVMYGGFIMEEIDEIDLFEKMCHPYTLRLLASSYGWGKERSRTEDFQKDSFQRETIQDENDLQEDYEKEQSVGGTGCPYAARCPRAEEICRKELPPCRELEAGHRVWCHQDIN